MSEERLRKVEEQLHSLTRAVRRIEVRLREVEGKAGQTPILPESALPPVETGPGGEPAAGVGESLGTVTLFSLLGRTFLVLGGAFLLRGITDAGLMPQGVGVLLGVVYALLWIVLADRSAGKGHPVGAGFHGVSAVLIGFPFLWEITARYRILSPGLSAAILAILIAAGLFVAWRRDLKVLAWGFSLAGLTTVTALLVSTGAVELMSLLLLAIGAATIWLSYSRRWVGVRWIAAILIDLVILYLAVVVTTPRGTCFPFENFSPLDAEAVAAGLLIVYVGSFALHALISRRDVTAFEVFQSIVALLVGFGGALWIAQKTGSDTMLLRITAIAAGVICYAVGFAYVRRLRGRSGNFLFYTSLAIVLVLLGSPAVAGSLGVLWAGLAIVAAILGGRFNRVTLRGHCAVYAFAAVIQAGLLPAAFDAFTGNPVELRLPSPSSLTVLVLVFTCYIGLVATRKYRQAPQLARVPRVIVLLLSVAGLSGVAVVLAVRIVFGGPAAGSPEQVALVRTGVLTVAAVLLAFGRRRVDLPELAWPVYPVLLISGLKLFLEDMQRCRPACLFLAFALYGIALIVVPRLLRAGKNSTGEAAPADHAPGEDA